jgi:dTDP-4-dehydrorhamnose reductase
VAFLTISSDLVFDGKKDSPYTETDTIGPVNLYGENAAAIEKLVQAETPTALIVRTGPLFDLLDKFNFVSRALRSLSSEEPFKAANDVIVSPTYTLDLSDACLDLLIDGEKGVWHLAHPAQVSWADVAIMASRIAGISSASLRSCSVKEMGLRIRVPRHTALTSERGILLPSLEDALGRFIRDSEPHGASNAGYPEPLAA